MKLQELAQEPALIKLTIIEPKIVEKYGEELDFYMLSSMILDEHGKAVMDGKKILPIDVITEAIKLVGDLLGK